MSAGRRSPAIATASPLWYVTWSPSPRRSASRRDAARYGPDASTLTALSAPASSSAWWTAPTPAPMSSTVIPSIPPSASPSMSRAVHSRGPWRRYSRSSASADGASNWSSYNPGSQQLTPEIVERWCRHRDSARVRWGLHGTAAGAQNGISPATPPGGHKEIGDDRREDDPRNRGAEGDRGRAGRRGPQDPARR